MLALGLTWRRWRAQHVVLIAVVLATLAPYILIQVLPRYLPSASFAYLIWIGLGVNVLAERLGASLGRVDDRSSITSVRNRRLSLHPIRGLRMSRWRRSALPRRFRITT